MKYLLVAIFALPFVLADDPAPALCLPYQFQSQVYDFNNRLFINLLTTVDVMSTSSIPQGTDDADVTSTDIGVSAVDFNKNLTVLTFVRAGIRIIYDLTAMKAYLIANETACTNFNMQASEAIFQCVPDNATPLTTNTTRIGLDTNGIQIKTFQVVVNDPVAIRIAITDTRPAIPVLREVLGANAVFTGNVLFFTNTVLSIDPQLFVFPLVCPDLTVAG